MNTVQIIRSTASNLWKKSGQKLNRLCRRTPVVETEIKPAVDEFVHEVKTAEKIAQKVSKPTDIDIINFHQYMLAKKLDLKCTPEEIKTLLSFEGKEFHSKSFEFFLKKMKIPQKTQPQLVYSAQNPEFTMVYDFLGNTVHINTNYTFQSKEEFLGYLRHELQHYQQNIQIFRHELYGKDMVDFAVKKSVEFEIKNIDYAAKNWTMEQIKEFGFNEEGIKTYKYLKDLIKNNKLEEYEQYLKNTTEELTGEYKQHYEGFRQKVVEEYGVLKANTKEGDRASRYFNETVSSSTYVEQDGKINTMKYMGDIRETEALLAQDIMRLNIQGFNQEKNCYLKYLKDCIKKLPEPEGECKEFVERLKDDAKKAEQELEHIPEEKIDARKVARFYFD